MKYYKITFSSKIDKIGENLVFGGEASGSSCSNKVLKVAIPSTLSTISDMAFYECQNLGSLAVDAQSFLRPEGTNEIPIRLNNKTYVEKIKEYEPECTVLPFKLLMPLCPEDKQE